MTFSPFKQSQSNQYKQMIAIINYRAGNLQNLKNALDFLGEESMIVDSPEMLASATKLILPGVGAFGHAMENLNKYGFVEPIKDAVKAGKPLLGICLGMQLLFTKSFEEGEHEGLGLIPGEVRRFTHSDLKIPQMGWNNVSFSNPDDPVVKGAHKKPWFYFVHSYACYPSDPADKLGETDYGDCFCSLAKKGNVYGMQFHPEKSQEDGLALIKNFCNFPTMDKKEPEQC
ncbi:MAG: imidazole glycerol phosphate synthase subunit HisH [SAR324 cluster bacterium]|nr:imidazole glycerol phosphate synthase subunit HisH [SAR324 cluster bacterium]